MDNLHTYSVEIRFDDETANSNEKRIYSNFLKKYSASAGTVDKNGTFNLFITHDKPLKRKELEKELEDIEIVSFEEVNLD